MSEFVWFDLRTADAEGAESFYSDLLGWRIARDAEMPPMIAGEDGPWALIGGAMLPGGPQWLPYVRVEDLDEATARAEELGAQVLHAKTEGPAGSVTAIADPTGAPVALWQPRDA
ncbi:MAG: VOC family protein [Gaiellaceae bacterium]